MPEMLSESCKVYKVEPYGASGTTTLNSDIIDTAGFDGVLILANIETANSGNGLQLRHGDDAALGDVQGVEGSELLSDGTSKDFVIDLVKPTKRYLRADLVRGAATIVGGIWAILYRGDNRPKTSASTALKQLRLNSPGDGTP